MERRALGTSGLEVPVVGMGTWRTFDVRGADAVARCRAVLDEAYAAGATLFDTSPMYGASERVLSETMGARRDDALVADKLWTPDDDEAERQASERCAGMAVGWTCIRCTTSSARGRRLSYCSVCAGKARFA
jgi:aryl-alcohol dehydrogenase-like predicted oxidoreductase